ncbi:Nif3-like dinuclear metal center hexameric protein [Tepidibacillus fermentans]|uniref:GTP cyclohydrolase 1 type 2 homolog n=1 Tax=Tepidibacillus fermentans TaxID=1281767 RepID=A0A4R3KJL6_9BACI|nr:Nif3-like dinuclear metal center hexameric protein [Tepidibacillus fermentans]TCS83712.1 dinuclear metal center YbgI/SA1388 family protein [Tepidibacillus fermentans]
MFAKGQTIIQLIEQLAPKYLAVEGDRIGLQVGTLQKEIKKVMLTLDVLENVVDEAIEQQIDFIISHHASIYRPLKHLRTDLPQGRIYQKLLKHDIAVYTAHTNLDVALGGVNDALAKRIGIQATEFLQEVYQQKLKKIVVYVPESHQQVVLDALYANGAGWIGNYSHCSFTSSGIGTFMPREGTNPYIGQQGKLERVNEVRIETIIPEEKQNQAIKAMIKAHPYEEVAYDIYPLDIEGKAYGIGRVGVLEQELTLKEFALQVKRQLELDGARVIGDFTQKIRKVAIVGGDGNSFVPTAAFKGVDVLITGDIYYHVAHEAMAEGLAIIDVGHNVEKWVLPELKAYLEQAFKERNIMTEVYESKTDTNPFQFI